MTSPVRRLARWGAYAAFALLLTGCCTVRSGGAVPSAAGAGYPGELRAPGAVPGDFLYQQRVTARWGGGEARGFDAALQKRGDVLTLVGLTPMGTKAFVVTQTGDEVVLDNTSGQDMPFPPRYIMLDVQRVLFPWLEGEPPHDGAREGEVGGERVVETWHEGELVERCFVRLDHQPEGRLCVSYEGWAPGEAAPRRAVLDNAWFGYRLEIETTAQERLP